MKVWTDMLTGVEYFSDAKKLEEVEFKDPETGEKIDVGLVRCAASKQTAGGGKIDIGRSSGGGAGFGGGEKAEADDDGGDDGEEAEETKLDQFWNFPTIENEHTFSSFADFKKNYFTPFWQKLSVAKGLAKDDADMKTKGKKFMNNTLKWIKANWDELQFFGPEVYFMDGTEIDAKFEGVSFCTSLAIVRYEGSDAYFYFLKDGFKATTF